MWIHRLTEVDPSARTAVCENCGPVKIVVKGSRWVCHVGRNQTRPSKIPGLSREDARALREGKLCAICGKPAQALDHNHLTGKVREPLCLYCNTRIGALEDWVWLGKAKAYLRKHESPVD